MRANNVEAIEDASKKVDGEFKSGDLAVCGENEIFTVPGYLPVIPLKPSKSMVDIAKEIKNEFISKFNILKYKEYMDGFDTVFKKEYNNE